MTPSERAPRDGLVYGVLAYGMWGFFPLYWAMLKAAGSVEVLAWRIGGTFVFLSLAIVALGRLRLLRALTRRQVALLAAASVMVTCNWLVYIWGVMNEHVVETSLGYFINPLMTVALGVVVLRERLWPAQVAALALATVAVVGLTVELGRLPYLALVLASTFAGYGLVKKRAAAPPLLSVWLETAFMAPLALSWLGWLHAEGAASFGQHGAVHDGLLLGAGVVTALPLLAFAAAANRVPLTLLGLLQYLAPTLQFACGVWLLHERVSPARWAGFGLVWAALLVFTADSLWRARRTPRVSTP